MLTSYRSQYTFDKGLNLLQKNNINTVNARRFIACQTNNRGIDDLLYHSLNLNANEKANLNTALLNKGIFDTHGNQKKSSALLALDWDYGSILQTTTKVDVLSGGQTSEYYSYAKSGQRSRKVTERTNANGDVIEIREALYLNQLEYRTTWFGQNLRYDGEIVTDLPSDQPITPYEKYVVLRICQSHKQVVRKIRYLYKDDAATDQQETTFSLDGTQVYLRTVGLDVKILLKEFSTIDQKRFSDLMVEN